MSKCAYCRSELVGPTYPRVLVLADSPSFCDRLCCRQYIRDGGPERPQSQRSAGEAYVPKWSFSIREWLYD